MRHDCRTAQERLLDLVFKELDEEQTLGLLAEIEDCPECQEQHRSMSLTLFAFDQATASMLPQENFWSDYQEKLERRLNTLADDAAASVNSTHAALVNNSSNNVVPVWKRFLNMSIPVPVPVAALALLLLAGSSLFALMRSTTTASSSAALVEGVPPAAAPVAERTRIVEVPLVQEKVVTRIVYVARNNRAAKNERDARLASPRVEERRENAPPASAPSNIQDAPMTNARAGTAESTHAALAGFKPAGEVKLRIIKGTYRDDK